MKRFIKKDKVGEYTLLNFLGDGTTAEVWSAISDDGSTTVALKIFHLTNSQDVSQLKEEYESTSHLVHNHIVVPEMNFVFDNHQVMVMKLCDRSLWQDLNLRQSRASSSEYYSEKELAKIILDVSSALKYLHFGQKVKNGEAREEIVIHNDIKPGNILLNENDGLNEYFLTDFGIIRNITGTVPKDKVKAIGLTYAYAPPERFEKKPTIHVNSDIFSLGASIYELTNGMGEVPLSSLLNHNKELARIEGNYSNRFKNLIMAMLDRDPYQRPDATKLYEMTSQYLNGNGWSAMQKSNTKDHICANCDYPLHSELTTCPNCLESANSKYNSSKVEDGKLDPQTTLKPECPQCQNELIAEGIPCSKCFPRFTCKKCGTGLESEFSKCNNCKSNYSWIKYVIALAFLIGISYLIKDYVFSNKESNIEYDQVSPYNHSGYACAIKDGKAGVVDKQLQAMSPFTYSRCVCGKLDIVLYDNNKKIIFEPTVKINNDGN